MVNLIRNIFFEEAGATDKIAKNAKFIRNFTFRRRLYDVQNSKEVAFSTSFCLRGRKPYG